ncbi:MAG: inositol monophosphatase family protein [Bacteroidota bacterium]
MDHLNYTQILEESIPIVKKAGAFLLEHFRKVGQDQIEDKDVNSLVSYVDRQAEAILVQELQTLLPDSTFITEENTVENQESEFTWIIDPLDGTTNFLFGLPHFAVSVALKHQEEIVVGIVYHPSQEECFYATKAGGAFVNGTPIKVKSTKYLKEALIATGMPFNNIAHVDQVLSLIRYWKQHTRGVRRLGSAALDLAYVAAGRFDAYVEWGLNAWDIAAGILLVEEAGGKVTDLKAEQDYLKNGEIVAASSALYDALKEGLPKDS